MHGGDGAPPPGAAGAQTPAALASPCTDNPEEREEIMKERGREREMKIMIIIVMIAVILVKCNDSVAFTPGALDTIQPTPFILM